MRFRGSGVFALMAILLPLLIISSLSLVFRIGAAQRGNDNTAEAVQLAIVVPPRLRRSTGPDMVSQAAQTPPSSINETKQNEHAGREPCYAPMEAPQRPVVPLETSQRPAVPLETIFVFGPESTGTRFMSRSLSKMLEPMSKWDGEAPACKVHEDPFHKIHVKIQHISLPWGGYCDGAIHIVSDLDLCDKRQRLPFSHFFVDIEEVLRRTPHSKAIVLTRDPLFAMRSVLEHHCHEPEVAAKERDAALELIRKAISSPDVGDRVLHVQYESLGVIPRILWSQITQFFDLPQLEADAVPKFTSGNQLA
ncbi:Hypothetical Protein FCC1311_088732 [Hondaea fermentalgiana]|uniref:Sulfotransferase domain-containing protein n=1 Tax=Hondaea fermentalgiana TaxID=2315210 RepID=A0A2R5GSB4_9STRA|nr:Hypothetical Protein FCC1311_088732 [Hondaea fermentalgiana]|eukprot:GBG32648.1 Hypothetical Protein FCC1311_088732 [Hondaea fermentalgiana]